MAKTATRKSPEAPKPLTVVKDEEHGPEVIARAIEEVAAAAQKLLGSRLSRRAIVLLIEDSIPAPNYGQRKVGKPAINAVLDAAAGLRKYIVRPGRESHG